MQGLTGIASVEFWISSFIIDENQNEKQIQLNKTTKQKLLEGSIKKFQSLHYSMS